MRVRVKATPRPKTLDPRSRHKRLLSRLPTADSSVAQKPSLSLSLMNRQSTVSTVSVSAEAEERRTRQAGREKKKHTCIKKYGQRTADTEGARLQTPDSKLQTPPKARQNNEKKRTTFFFTAICFTLYPGLPASSLRLGASSQAQAKQQNRKTAKQQAADDRSDPCLHPLVRPKSYHVEHPVVAAAPASQPHQPASRISQPTECPGHFRLRI